jgi:hypothetical protein
MAMGKFPLKSSFRCANGRLDGYVLDYIVLYKLSLCMACATKDGLVYVVAMTMPRRGKTTM